MRSDDSVQTSDKKKALIIGGGIGGVTVAIALQRAGFDVTVFERADVLLEVGSGLPLWSSTLRALKKLELTSVLEALGPPVPAGSITTWRGEVLVDLSTEKRLQRLGTVNAVVHRAELLALLLEVLGEDRVQLATTCVGFTQDETGVWARFADGRIVYGDLLLGADGLHSVIREQLFGPFKPKYMGYTCWRGVASMERTDLTTYAWGNGYQIGIFSMSRNRAYWFAQRNAPEGEQEKASGRKRNLLETFHDWHDPIPTVIEATDESHILRNDIYQSEPLRHWSRGRVTLLGDAAHAMTPNLGQGACQAIEDALALADCLKAEPNVAAALQLYEKRRTKRVNRIKWLSGLVGPAVQMENPLVVRTRNALVKRIPMGLIVQRLMWLLDYNP
jgi:2-polyprenyl-6-methoxyphenol hydroxylase-like FAD-dependent oxidoreductase